MQPRPVGMVREHEAAVQRTPPPRTAHRHPAAGECIARIGEAAHPGRAAGRGRRQHQRAGERAPVGDLGDQRSRRQRHARRAVRAIQRLDRTVADDRPDRGVDAGEDALRLAEGVAEQHARTPGGRVRAPPCVDAGEGLARRCPPVDRQPEGRLGDEGVAAHRLEGCAGRIGLDLVVAAHHPDLAAVLEPNLRRAQHVAGRKQRHPHTVHFDRLAVGQRLQRDAGTQPRPQHALGGCGREVGAVAGPRVVGMRMRDHRTRHRPPRVDEEVARLAVQPLRPPLEQRPGCGGHRLSPRARGRPAAGRPPPAPPRAAPARW